MKNHFKELYPVYLFGFIILVFTIFIFSIEIKTIKTSTPKERNLRLIKKAENCKKMCEIVNQEPRIRWDNWNGYMCICE
jgi:hypothetical protein